MGDIYIYQQLTRWDRVSVVLYRLGIVFSTADIVAGVIFALTGRGTTAVFNILLVFLYISVGLGVFFIHLYISKFHRALRGLYLLSLVGFAVLLLAGKGDAAGAITGRPFGPLLIIPLSGCLGFITAKEAFCFKLKEGYLLAILMPFYLLLIAAGNRSIVGPIAIAALMVFFTLRKVFMPIHYDIGDKSAYY